MLRRPPVLTRPATPFPYTPLFRSKSVPQLDFAAQVGAPLLHPYRDRAFAMIVTAFLFLAAMIMRGVRTRGDAIIGIEIADRNTELAAVVDQRNPAAGGPGLALGVVNLAALARLCGQ